MNSSNQHSDGWGSLVIGALLIYFPGLIIALVVLALAVKAPKITGMLIVAATVNGFIHFLTEGGTASDETGFMLIPVVLLFLALIAAGCGLFAWGLRGGLAAATALPIQSNTTLQQACDRTSAPDEQDDEEKMYAAMEEAKRIAKLTRCGQEDRKRIFEMVFVRQCERSGVKVNRVVWKRRDHSRVGSETETEEED